jgi:hypothetical protein
MDGIQSRSGGGGEEKNLSKKVTLSLYLIKYHAIKTYGRVEV